MTVLEYQGDCIRSDCVGVSGDCIRSDCVGVSADCIRSDCVGVSADCIKSDCVGVSGDCIRSDCTGVTVLGHSPNTKAVNRYCWLVAVMFTFSSVKLHKAHVELVLIVFMAVCKAFHDNVKLKHIPVVDISFKMSLVSVLLSISHFLLACFWF